MNENHKTRVTLKDIARLSGYTVNTVSHALRGKNDISAETRSKILKIAKDIGYVGNTLASSLRSGRSHTVAVIVSDVVNPHFGYSVHNIEACLGEAGYSTIILCTKDVLEKEMEAVKTAIRHLADGVLICPTQLSEAPIDLLRSSGIPYVIMGRQFAREDDYVLCDDEGGAFQLVSYLLSQGHRQILYVGGNPQFSSEIERRAGYRRAMIDQGFESEIMEADYDRYEALEEANRLTELLTAYHPTAVVAFRDAMAWTMINAFRKAGLRVPDDISVAGFDYIAEHLHFLPPLTTVTSVGENYSGAAARRLLFLLKEGEQPKKRICLPMRLIDAQATVRPI